MSGEIDDAILLEALAGVEAQLPTSGNSSTTTTTTATAISPSFSMALRPFRRQLPATFSAVSSTSSSQSAFGSPSAASGAALTCGPLGGVPSHAPALNTQVPFSLHPPVTVHLSMVTMDRIQISFGPPARDGSLAISHPQAYPLLSRFHAQRVPLSSSSSCSSSSSSLPWSIAVQDYQSLVTKVVRVPGVQTLHRLPLNVERTLLPIAAAGSPSLPATPPSTGRKRRRSAKHTASAAGLRTPKATAAAARPCSLPRQASLNAFFPSVTKVARQSASSPSSTAGRSSPVPIVIDDHDHDDIATCASAASRIRDDIVDGIEDEVEESAPVSTHDEVDAVDQQDPLAKELAAIPVMLRRKLMPYQVEGVRYGLQRGGRILLADEMGLGKTFQSIALASAYQSEWPLLVICPSSLRAHWGAELVDNIPALSEADVCIVMNGKQQLYGRAVVLSYALAANMSAQVTEIGFRVVIADESHYLKNAKAKRSRGVHASVSVK
jgi:SNF2-related domain